MRTVSGLRRNAPVLPGALCALLAAVCLAQAPLADGQLRSGAQHFREERYADALVAFKAAERLGADAEVRWYIAASLAKLGRAEEAVEAFRRAEEGAGHGDDALLSYHYAMACYDARLYGCAQARLRSVGARAGPRIGAQAKKVLAELEPLLARVPKETVEALMVRGGQLLEAGRSPLAVAYFEEAALLAGKRKDLQRQQDAQERADAARRQEPRGAVR